MNTDPEPPAPSEPAEPTKPTKPDGALPPADSAKWDAAFAAAFGPDESGPASVLYRLAGATGRDTHVLLRDASSDAAPPVLAGGGASRHGRYRILGEIARGGVGVILRGRDVDLGRDLAMKVLRDDHAGNTELIQRFVEEAQIGGQLQHPGIVPVYELGVDDEQRPYFTMKLVQGDTLARLLEKRPAPEHDRARFLRTFEQVCDAIGYAHARGVVHRDLKPANVLVGSFGEVQVVDWGFAKVLARGGVVDEASAHRDARDASLIATVRSGPGGMESQVGSVMGTPSYMPPEQARGAVDALDERTDVFALGAILCEILTGKPPYLGENLAQTALKAQRADLAEALARLDGCGADEALVSLARACLSEKPEERPADAGVVAKAISTYVASVEERAHEAVTAAARAQERAANERRNRRLTLALAVTVVLAVAAAAGGYALHRGRIAAVEGRIHASLRTASEVLAVGDATDAAALVDQARALAEDASVSADTLESIADVAGEIAAAQADLAFVAALEAVRATDDVSPDEANDAYVAAFADAGIDILAADPDGVAARLDPGRDIARAAAFAIDDWVWRMRVRRGSGAEQARHLLAVARRLDDDPWRNDLRDAALEGDAERLAQMAGEADMANLPAQTVNVLAAALRGVGDMETSWEVVERGVRAHPGDFFLQLHRGMTRMRLGKDGDGARTSLEIARALRPEALAPRMILISLALRDDDVDRARIEVDDMVALDARDPRTRIMRAEVLAAEDRPDDALAVLDELLAERQDLAPAIHRDRVRLLMKIGNVARAREALATWLAQMEERRSRSDDTGEPGSSAGRGGPGRDGVGRDRVGRDGVGRGGRMGRRSGGRRGGRHGGPDMTAELDTDEDGRVSADELPETLRPYHDLLDRDGDGSLSGFELRILRGLDLPHDDR